MVIIWLPPLEKKHSLAPFLPMILLSRRKLRIHQMMYKTYEMTLLFFIMNFDLHDDHHTSAKATTTQPPTPLLILQSTPSLIDKGQGGDSSTLDGIHHLKTI